MDPHIDDIAIRVDHDTDPAGPGNLLRCRTWKSCVHGAIVLRDRIRDKDKDPSFSAKPTRAKDSVFGPKSMNARLRAMAMARCGSTVRSTALRCCAAATRPPRQCLNMRSRDLRVVSLQRASLASCGSDLNYALLDDRVGEVGDADHATEYRRISVRGAKRTFSLENYSNYNDTRVPSFILPGAPLANKTGHSGRSDPAAHHKPFENRPAADDSDFRIVNFHLINH